MTRNSLIAAVAAAAVFALALFLGVSLLPLVIVYLVATGLVFFVPAIRTPFFKLLGLTPPTLSEILADFESIGAKLTTHAEQALADAKTHTAQAETSTKAAAAATASAAHATAVASNINTLIAPPAKAS